MYRHLDSNEDPLVSKVNLQHSSESVLLVNEGLLNDSSNVHTTPTTLNNNSPLTNQTYPNYDLACIGTSTNNEISKSAAEKSVGAFDKQNHLLTSDRGSILLSTVNSEPNKQMSTRIKNSHRYGTFLWMLIGILFILLIVALVFVFYLWNKPTVELTCQTLECVETAQKILSGMQFNQNPCTNFYEYSCGGWIERHHIPPGTNSWTVFSELSQTAEYFAKSLLENTDQNDTSLGLHLAQIYYKSCLSEHDIDNLDLKPLTDMFKQAFGGWRLLEKDQPGSRSTTPFLPEQFDFTDVVQKFVQYGQGIDIFQLLIEKDPTDSSKFGITLAPGVVSMQPEYYLETKDEKIIKVVEYFKVLMKKYATMVGVPLRNLTAMEDVFEFEKLIAQRMGPRATQSIETNYLKMNITKLQDFCPAIQWRRLFKNLFNFVNYSIVDSEKVIIGDQKYFKQRCELYDEYLKSPDKINILHDVAIWRMMWSLNPYMPTRVRKIIKTYDQANTGVTELPQRWLTCVRNTEDFFGMTIARKFVAEHFDEKSKIMATEMISGIKMAFKRSFHQLDWMDKAAKEGAERKVDRMGDSIGYPDDISNIEKENIPYVGISLKKEEFLNNSLKLAHSKLCILLYKMFNDTVKTWEMAPHIVNAFYNPRENHIYFPAGILQKPFYDAVYPLALNYGGIGVVVGHEIVHAFDRQGSKYDEKGNLRKWWSETTRREFEKNSECMVQQYGNYTVQGKNVNGQLTLSENIADNGGLKAAYRAYQSLQTSGMNSMKLPGVNLTMDQLFFISFAQVWCKRQLPQAAVHTVMFDVHSPERFRVIGTLSNSEEFAEAFSCPKGSLMNPVDKCVLW